MDDSDEERRLRELVRARGAQLRARYGAHGIGVGRKHAGGAATGRLAVVFYVARKGAGPEPVPEVIEFVPEGEERPVALLTDVVETPAPEPEG